MNKLMGTFRHLGIMPTRRMLIRSPNLAEGNPAEAKNAETSEQSKGTATSQSPDGSTVEAFAESTRERS